MISGIGDTLSGRLFLFDALTFETRTLNIHRDPENPLNGENPTQTELIDYQQFCGIGPEEDVVSGVKEISVEDLSDLQQANADFQLVDVREAYEYDIANLGGELIPLSEISKTFNRISSDKQVVVHCRSGVRSAQAIEILEKEYGFTNLYNLKGGILAYADKIDSSLAKY